MHRRYTSFACGLDLGQANAFTAFAVVEKTVVEQPNPDDHDEVSYGVRHLERFPIGTPYADIFRRVRERVILGQLGDTPLIVDRTGVGNAVVEMLKRACPESQVCEATITSGMAAVNDTKTAAG